MVSCFCTFLIRYFKEHKIHYSLTVIYDVHSRMRPINTLLKNGHTYLEM